jgi:hypothetical protein
MERDHRKNFIFNKEDSRWYRHGNADVGYTREYMAGQQSFGARPGAIPQGRTYTDMINNAARPGAIPLDRTYDDMINNARLGMGSAHAPKSAPQTHATPFQSNPPVIHAHQVYVHAPTAADSWDSSVSSGSSGSSDQVWKGPSPNFHSMTDAHRTQQLLQHLNYRTQQGLAGPNTVGETFLGNQEAGLRMAAGKMKTKVDGFVDLTQTPGTPPLIDLTQTPDTPPRTPPSRRRRSLSDLYRALFSARSNISIPSHTPDAADAVATGNRQQRRLFYGSDDLRLILALLKKHTPFIGVQPETLSRQRRSLFVLPRDLLQKLEKEIIWDQQDESLSRKRRGLISFFGDYFLKNATTIYS